MPARAFAVTFDYRCPFARIATDHILTALRAGTAWDVTFLPFSLSQAHVDPGRADVWDDPDADSALVATQSAVVVRDRFAEAFLDVHEALFDVRHRHGRSLRDPAAIREALVAGSVDPDLVQTEIAAGWPLDQVRKEHERAVVDHDVWGVPTFIADGRAAFVRLMEAPEGDAELATSSITRILDLLTGWGELNEFKHTSLDR